MKYQKRNQSLLQNKEIKKIISKDKIKSIKYKKKFQY